MIVVLILQCVSKEDFDWNKADTKKSLLLPDTYKWNQVIEVITTLASLGEDVDPEAEEEGSVTRTEADSTAIMPRSHQTVNQMLEAKFTSTAPRLGPKRRKRIPRLV